MDENKTQSTIQKLIRLALSTSEEGEALSSLARIRAILRKGDLSAPDVFVSLVEQHVEEVEGTYSSGTDAYMDNLARSVKMPFGKYKGMTIFDILREDASYIRWLNTQVDLYEGRLKDLVEFYARK